MINSELLLAAQFSLVGEEAKLTPYKLKKNEVLPGVLGLVLQYTVKGPEHSGGPHVLVRAALLLLPLGLPPMAAMMDDGEADWVAVDRSPKPKSEAPAPARVIPGLALPPPAVNSPSPGATSGSPPTSRKRRSGKKKKKKSGEGGGGNDAAVSGCAVADFYMDASTDAGDDPAVARAIAESLRAAEAEATQRQDPAAAIAKRLRAERKALRLIDALLEKAEGRDTLDDAQMAKVGRRCAVLEAIAELEGQMAAIEARKVEEVKEVSSREATGTKRLASVM